MVFSGHVHRPRAAFVRRGGGKPHLQLINRTIDLPPKGERRRGGKFPPSTVPNEGSDFLDDFSPGAGGSTIRADLGAHGAEGVLLEVTVPACSYRSGRRLNGVGLASFRKGGTLMVASVLWLPDRLGVLYSYLAVMLLIVVSRLCCRKK